MLAESGESLSQASGKLCERKRLQKACCLHLLKVKVKLLIRVWLFATLWTVDCQAPPSMGFFQARILEWVPTFFSRVSSWPRHWTQAPSIVDRLFTLWATRESRYSPLFTQQPETSFSSSDVGHSIALLNPFPLHFECTLAWFLLHPQCQSVHSPAPHPPVRPSVPQTCQVLSWL